MALSNAEGFERGARVNLHFEASEDFLRLLVHGGPVELLEEAAVNIVADENIFGDGQFIEQHRFLVNRCDTDFVRRFRVRQRNRYRFIKQFAFFRLINPGHDFDQRGFTRAIFTDQRRDFARPQIQMNVFEGAYAGENFGYSLQGQQWCGECHGQFPIQNGGWRERLSTLRLAFVRRVSKASPANTQSEDFGEFIDVAGIVNKRLSHRTAAVGIQLHFAQFAHTGLGFRRRPFH